MEGVINKSKLKFSNLSLVDDFGRVFFYEGKVYRAIQPAKEDYCKTLINSDLFHELQRKGLIAVTKISELKIEGYDLILEHEKLVQTFKHEWSFSMLRDAALTIFEINEICNKYGWELKDAHFYNMLFRGTAPVWIDIGSIEKKRSMKGPWRAFEEFLNTAVIPLTFLSQNKLFIGSKLLESYYYGMLTIPSQSLEESGLLKLLELTKEPYLFNFRSRNLLKTRDKLRILNFFVINTNSFVNKIIRRKTRLFSYERKTNDSEKLSCVFPIESICEYLNELPVPSIKSMWQGYHESYRERVKNHNSDSRFERIIEIIKETEAIETIVDLAGNEGYFSQLLWNQIRPKRLIVVDYDSNAIDRCYNTFKSLKAENVISLHFNFMYSPDNDGTPSRLRSDLVLALAVTHHLILTANFSLQAILERLRSFSHRYVMVEFMPLGLWSSENNNSPSFPDWYNIEWFRNIFETYFNIIVEEKIEVNRILFFGEIRK